MERPHHQRPAEQGHQGKDKDEFLGQGPVEKTFFHAAEHGASLLAPALFHQPPEGVVVRVVFDVQDQHDRRWASLSPNARIHS